MSDYKEMYFELFNSVTTAIQILQKAQQDGEDAYADSKELELVLGKNAENKTENTLSE